MPFVIGGAVLGGALIGGAASKSAAKTQAGAAADANAIARQQFDQTQGNLAPWLKGGEQGQANLNYLLGFNPGNANPSSGEVAGNLGFDKGMLLKPFGMDEFKESPAYQFNLAEGRKAIDKASAARGKYYQPSTLQDIAKYSQGLASNEYQNAFNNYNTSMGNIYSRLQNLGGSGQNAAAQMGGYSQNYANTAGNNLIGAGNASAAGQVGQANAVTGAMGQGYNAYVLQQILGRNQAPTYSTTPTGGQTGSFDPMMEGVFA